MNLRNRYVILISVCFLLGPLLLAQAVSGTLTGVVTTDGSALPGVTVTVTSPQLQGSRVAITGNNGVYNFPALPPGKYSIVFEMGGLETVTKSTSVTLNQSARADASMGIALTESIVVTASAPSALETTAVSSNFDKLTVENLPINRTLVGVVSIAPGVSDEGPNNQVSISGAPSYSNLYLVNGAVVNDTLRGQPESLFIEDAIQETTVLTGNISAEYGRFSGGVVSAITKSGGNEFSGSFRDSLTNSDWTNKTPFAGEADHNDNIDEVYEATLGGRIVRDRLWFFLAGRLAETNGTGTTVGTLIPYATLNKDERFEGKLTGQITSKHSVVGSFLDRTTTQEGNIFGAIVDLASLDNRELPNTLMSVNYNGILSSNLLIEAQYSTREFAFVGSGSDFQDEIYGTLLRDNTTLRRAWSPTFCGVCDDENRDNEYIIAKATYFLSTSRMGSHNIVGGIEDFSEQRFSNNHQSGSDYRIWGDFLYAGQDFFFHVEPGVDGDGTYIQWNPILLGSQTSDTTTESLFINDKWVLNQHWSFNLGMRYDKNDAIDQAGTKTASDSGFSPRVGTTWDVKGDGRHHITAGYGRFITAIDNGINDGGSSAGSPASYYYDYGGPEINPFGCETTGTCLPTEQVIASVFDWFHENVDPSTDFFYADVPGVNVQINGRLESPGMTELSIGYGTQLGSKGYLRLDYINREWDNFYVQTTNLDTGRVRDSLGTEYDLTLIRNSDDGISREYDGVQIQGSYRILSRLSVGGNYTWSELVGNADSETSNSGTVTILSTESYPEYIDSRWNNPSRAILGDVENRANLWLAYDQPLGRFGALNFSLLEKYHSGFPYYSVGAVTLASSTGSNPGYKTPPASANYYFEGDKEYRTEDVTRTDLGINYTLPIGSVQLFAQAEVLNVFDESAIEDPSFLNQTVLTSRSANCRQGYDRNAARCIAFNPHTETPVEGVHWVKARVGAQPNNPTTSFGEATSSNAYQLPLTYRFSVGVRF